MSDTFTDDYSAFGRTRPHRLTRETEARTRRAATRAIASTATDTTDCAQLLDMLGLTPQDGLT